MIQLKTIDRHNFIEVIKLSVSEDQENYVASNVISLAQAKAQPECSPYAIYNDETLVGFIMTAFDEDDQEYWIYRLMIDQKYQHKGFGREALNCAIQLIKEDQDHHVIYISLEPENLHAKVMYEQFGFIEDGRVDGSEIIYRLDY